MANPFEARVTEGDVARVLQLIAKIPNRREVRQVSDLEGDYDYWFDGGACKMETGSTRFMLQDGTSATVGVLPWLSLSIHFRDGRRVVIQQDH